MTATEIEKKDKPSLKPIEQNPVKKDEVEIDKDTIEEIEKKFGSRLAESGPLN